MSSLPPLYRGWIEELLGHAVSAEPRATCDRCVMLDRQDEVSFNPSTKCCTYQPDLSNFHVGRVLFDDSAGAATSRQVLRQRIAQRVGVTPLGIGPAPIYALLYEGSGAAQATTSVFGRAPLLRCPHYLEREGGLCGMWRHREAQCATWFCRFERGALGKLFWSVLGNLLHAVETSLRTWAAAQAGLDDEALAELWGKEQARAPGKVTVDEQQLNNRVSPATYARLWGRFVDREADFFNLTAAHVAGLELGDVLRIGGSVVASAANALRVVARRLADRSFPARVSVAGGVVYQIGAPGRLRARLPSVPYDTLELPEVVVRALPRLERGPLGAAFAELSREGVPIDEPLVRALLDWGLVAPA